MSGSHKHACAVLLSFLLAGGHAGTADALTLTEGVKIATESNRLIRIVRRERDVAAAEAQIARARFLPEVNASLSHASLAYQPGALYASQAVRTTERRFISYGIDMRQLLLDFGARASLFEASQAAIESAGFSVERTRNLVALDFILAYLDLLEAGKGERVALREVERLESHLKTAQSLYAEGVITRNDLLQAEVRLSDARQRLLSVRNLKEVSASRVNNILSRPLRSEVHPEEAVADLPRVPGLDEAGEIAESRRPELKIIDREVRINEMEESARTTEYYPKVFADASYRFTENRYQLHEDNWSLVLGLTVNLFSGGSTRAEIAKIRYRREQLLEQRRRLADDIRLEVEKNFFDMRNAEEKLRVARDAIGQAEENLTINRLRYEEGLGTATDVLDAITLLAAAETNHYRAQYELQRAYAGLLYAMGADLAVEYREPQGGNGKEPERE
ncbi:MAG: TolC family protein [Alphaproteobacteria bacterium]|uniref:TolC family protein n=1 Tax=Candidatus Nitrobium versatile TaxID=2884831 RepID=A0A953J3D3_9BACT|nr:TolC family protein [Candidatus Nitrobium versatile]